MSLVALQFKTGDSGGREDGQTGFPETPCPPGKVLHHLQLPAAATPVKPALPYRVWHQNEQRGAWLSREDSSVSSYSFFFFRISGYFGLSHQKQACYFNATIEPISLHSDPCLLAASVSGTDRRDHLQHCARVAHKARAGGLGASLASQKCTARPTS